jgi:pimeloyl-ACP methyl ester carboxylesterase
MLTFVLVHGGWAGAHQFRQVRRLLLEAGHDVYTPSLTGQGERVHLASPTVNLSTHVDDVANAIWYQDLTDIVLLGHSYGGMVVSGVADRMPERIAHLVFLDAFQPADGQSLYDLNRAPSNSAPADGWRVAPRPRTEGETNPEMVWARQRRQPQSRATFEEKVSLSMPLEERAFSLTYVVASERPDPDFYFDAAAERLRANPRWTVRAVPGGHNMMVTHPRPLADLLLEMFSARPAVSA